MQIVGSNPTVHWQQNICYYWNIECFQEENSTGGALQNLGFLLGISDEDVEYFNSYSINETIVKGLKNSNNNNPCNSGAPSDSSGRESSICELFQLDIVKFKVSENWEYWSAFCDMVVLFAFLLGGFAWKIYHSSLNSDLKLSLIYLICKFKLKS